VITLVTVTCLPSASPHLDPSALRFTESVGFFIGNNATFMLYSYQVLGDIQRGDVNTAMEIVYKNNGRRVFNPTTTVDQCSEGK
jgi:hypothetical protein